jgi:hypothetical protein
MMRKRVLLIGATGTFGSRLAWHLSQLPEIHLILTSRSKVRAQAIVKRLLSGGAVASLEAAEFATAHGSIAAFKPWLVIDASGPFQFMDYRTPAGTIAAGAHFIDLADAFSYLTGFAAALDAAARAQNVVALAGVSTTPALTSAVVDDLVANWKRVDAIDIAIVPGGNNTVGPALVDAILSQAGTRVPVFQHGRLANLLGWMRGHTVTFPSLGAYRVTPVETVDAVVMPRRYGVTSRVSFNAGLVFALEQRSLELLARAHHVGLGLKTKWLARLLAHGRLLTRRFASDRGGMTIRVIGLEDTGTWAEAEWSLLANNGDGPHVPTLAAVAAVRLLLKDALPAGARMVLGEIPRDLIEREFKSLSLAARKVVRKPTSAPFQTVLGKSYGDLPHQLRDFHSLTGVPVWRGEAIVERGENVLSRIVGRIIGLPSPGHHKVSVSVERNAQGSETWTRIFGERVFRSIMTVDGSGSLVETFGPFQFKLALRSGPNGSALPVQGGTLLGFPLPQWLLPSSEAVESHDDQERFCFDVRINLPFGGLLAHYRGWLRPAKPNEVNHEFRRPAIFSAA